MTDLSTFVEPLKRMLAVPGTFADVFPSTSDDDLQASLADGFSEAQLYGFFSTLSLSEDAAGDFATDVDLSAAGGSLVIIFTAMRILRAQIRSMATIERYKAGTTEYEVGRPANVLRDELALLDRQRSDLIAQARMAARSNTVRVFDNYLGRVGMQIRSMGSFYAYEISQRNLAQAFSFEVGRP